MSKSDMGSINHIKNQWNILVIGNYYVNYQNYQNLLLLTSSDTKRTLMHLLLFTKSAQRELVSICTQSIHDRNWLSLPYILGNIQWLLHQDPNIWNRKFKFVARTQFLCYLIEIQIPDFDRFKKCFDIVFVNIIISKLF